MSDLMADGASFVAEQLTENLSRTVSYYDASAAQTITVQATKCPVKRGIDPEFGVLRINECDWLIAASELAINGTAFEPAKDDKVTDGTEVWQCLPLDGNAEQEARPLDPFGYAWRVHTKRIDV